MQSRTLCIIMGGGKGTRIYPLTKYRCKPAIPLGAKYRLIDVPISNCLNSGYNRILVLTQFNSQSLNKHIARTYRFDSFTKGFVEVLAASQSYESAEWFQGTADSVRQTLQHMNDPSIDQVVVLSGDQLYTLDLNDLHKFHYDNQADVTVACNPVPTADVHRFGIMDMDKNHRIVSFLEKPKDPSLIKQPPLKIDGQDHYLANMGIYVFKKDVLVKMLNESDKDDFGKEIIPDYINKLKVCAYTFEGYWSDIGTIGSYYEANIMMTEASPRFNVYNENWPFYTRPRHLPPAKLTDCHIDQSVVAEGCILSKVHLKKSLVGVRSVINRGTKIEESIIAGNDYYDHEAYRSTNSKTPELGIGANCVIRKAIVDKNVRIADNVQIINKESVTEGEGDGYTIRDGVVVIHKGSVVPSGSVI